MSETDVFRSSQIAVPPISHSGSWTPDYSSSWKPRRKISGIYLYANQQGCEHVQGVNIALGLPIVRTSVDHGTAFDIAWKGIASTQSLEAAMSMAIRLAEIPQN